MCFDKVHKWVNGVKMNHAVMGEVSDSSPF